MTNNDALKMPDEIYLLHNEGDMGEHLWCENIPNDEMEFTKYIRADRAAQGYIGGGEGYVLVPIDKPITNQMKAECIGEFSFCIDVPEIIEAKNGWTVTGEKAQIEVTVPWDVCKQIYKAMLKAAPKKEGE